MCAQGESKGITECVPSHQGGVSAGPGRIGRSLTGSEPAFNWSTYRSEPIEADDDTKIEFITDVEGNWDYFLMFVDRSEILFWKEDEERGAWGPGELRLRQNSVLVFGGDAPDKGPGDIRFVKTLLSLKHRYPSRVEIILGNRDINKLRFCSELEDDVDPRKTKIYWDENAKPYDKFIQGSMHTIGQELQDGPLAAMHWMLNCNMGCQVTTYKTRKTELALLNGRVTDTDVLESFRDCANPKAEDPWMLDLLRVGKLASIIRDALFVHADIPRSALGYVPQVKEEKLDSCQEWVDALNSWKNSEIAAYIAQPSWCTRERLPHEDVKWSCSDTWRIRGGAGLIDYGAPGAPGHGGMTVTYGNPFKNGNCTLVDPEVEDILIKWGIKRVLSGHQPHGQSPTVVRHPRSGLLRITGDTSFSHMASQKLFNKANNRGNVISVVTLHGDTVRIHGDMLDCAHDTLLHVDPKQDEIPHALVGRQLKSEGWVKAVVVPEEDGEGTMMAPTKTTSGKRKDSKKKSHPDGNNYHEAHLLKVVRGNGFKINMSVESDTQCCFMLKDEFQMENDHKFFMVRYGSLQGHMLDVGRELTLVDDAPDPDAYPTAATDSAPLVRVMKKRPTFTKDDFIRNKTYIFAPQGTIYNIRDPEKNRDPEQMQALISNIIQKVNELMVNKRVLFVSNNSKDSRLGIATKLQKMGIKFKEDPESHIISAGYTCAWFLKEAGKKKPFVVCSHTGLLDELRKIGIHNYVATINDDGSAKPEYLVRLDDPESIMNLINKHPDIDCVVAGWDQQLSTLKIGVAAMYLRLNPNLKLVSCSMDPSGVLGTFGDTQVHAVGNGVIANAICNAIGKEASFIIDVGKPSFIMLDQMRNPKSQGGFEVDLKGAVMIGDTLETDMELARKGGMKSCLVFSGVTSQAEFEDMDASSRPAVTWRCPTFASM